MLIDNDILELEKFFIDLDKDEAYIDSCNIIVFIEVQRRFNNFIQRFVHIKATIVILSKSKIIVNIHHLVNVILRDRDFLFESNELNLIIYAYMMNIIIETILIRNDKDQSIRIFKNLRLDKLIEINYSNIFHTNTNVDDVINLVRKISKITYQISLFKKILVVYITTAAVTIIVAFIVAISASIVAMSNYIILVSNISFISNISDILLS